MRIAGTLACALMFSSLAASQHADGYHKHGELPTGPFPLITVIAHGEPLTSGEQSAINLATTYLKYWEDECRSAGTPLPQLPKRGNPTEFEDVSDALVGVPLGREGVSGENDSHSASSSPQGDIGSHPTQSGGTVVVDGWGINLPSGTFKMDPGCLALTLAHELCHLAYPAGALADTWTEHIQVYGWLSDYYCALVECSHANLSSGFPVWESGFHCGCVLMMNLINWACYYCGTNYANCPYCLFFDPNFHVEDWVDPPPAGIREQISEVTFPGPLSNPGTGSLYLSPFDNELSLQWSSAATGSVSHVDIDFASALPGFQATCMGLPAPGDARQMIVGGYIGTVENGALVRVQFDVTTDPCFTVNYEYQSHGASGGMGAPRDVYVNAARPSHVVVLDDTRERISVVNIVSDSVTILRDSTQTPEINQCMAIAAYPNTTGGSNPVAGITFIASSDFSELVRISPISSAAQVEVKLFDIGGDLTIDHVVVD